EGPGPPRLEEPIGESERPEARREAIADLEPRGDGPVEVRSARCHQGKLAIRGHHTGSHHTEEEVRVDDVETIVGGPTGPLPPLRRGEQGVELEIPLQVWRRRPGSRSRLGQRARLVWGLGERLEEFGLPPLQGRRIGGGQGSWQIANKLAELGPGCRGWSRGCRRRSRGCKRRSRGCRRRSRGLPAGRGQQQYPSQ